MSLQPYTDENWRFSVERMVDQCRATIEAFTRIGDQALRDALDDFRNSESPGDSLRAIYRMCKFSIADRLMLAFMYEFCSYRSPMGSLHNIWLASFDFGRCRTGWIGGGILVGVYLASWSALQKLKHAWRQRHPPPI